MTNSHFMPDSGNAFDESLEILSKEIELSARWRRPAILMALCESKGAHTEASIALEEYLLDHDKEVVHLQVTEEPRRSILSDVQDSAAKADRVYFLDGFDCFDFGNGSSLRFLTDYMELVGETKIRSVLWLDQNGAARLAHQAPEFWISCQRVVEFDTPHEPQLLLNAAQEDLGFAEEEAILEESQADAPEDRFPETTQTNLLLKLGILYWRKGDFENASATLERALQTAVSLQDNQTEAECYNALALVKSSMGRHEEAIEAYRQALRLVPDQTTPWNQMGNLCLKTHRNDEAIVAFQKTIERNPDDPVAWIGLGRVYSQIGYLNEAISAYQKAIGFAPSFPQPWNELGNLYAVTGRLDDAIQAYQKSIEMDERSLPPRLGLARLLVKVERYPDAVKAFQRALDLASENSLAWNELGQVHLKLNDPQTAVRCFSKAAELAPDFGRAYSNLALASTLTGKPREAVAYHSRSIELAATEEERAEYWNRLADTYRQLREYENAVSAYQMADDLVQNRKEDRAPKEAMSQKTPKDKTPASKQNAEPERGETPMQFALPKMKKSADRQIGNAVEMTVPQQTKKSAVVEEAAANDDLMDANDWNEKGNARIRAGDYENAIHDYKKAIALDGSFGQPYNNLAFAYLMLNRLDEALVQYVNGIELLDSNRDKAVSWNGIGFIYRCRKDYHNAMAAYQKADELDPENANHHENVDYLHTDPGPQNTQVWMELGDMFFKAGAYQEAVSAYRQAATIAPNSGECFSNLALALVFLGKYREAVHYYLKSLSLFQQNEDKAVAWNRLGDVYRKLNEQDNAIAAYQMALKLNNESADLLTRARFSLLSNCLAAG